MWRRRVVAGNIYTDHKSRFEFCVPNDRLIDGAVQITEHVERGDFTNVLTMERLFILAKVEMLPQPTMPMESELC